MRRKAFTLIELLVVIAIIALLLAIVVPAMRKAKEVARRVICGSGMRQTMIGLKTYGETYGGKLIPLARISGTANFQTGVGVVYSDNRSATTPITPWSDFYPWMGAVSHVLTTQGVPYIPAPKAYHLGLLYELGIITNPEVFYCPAQPLTTALFGIPYRYENYTSKGGYQWGTYPAVCASATTGAYVRTSFNYWVHEKIRWSELHASKIVLVDNLHDWNAIPHRKAGDSSAPLGVSAGFADGSVSFCMNDEMFKKTAVYGTTLLWPGCDTPATDDGPGNRVASFAALLSVLSQNQ
jgi:prepilin-type N-terminal cleavage/methylation domain-containing protein